MEAGYSFADADDGLYLTKDEQYLAMVVHPYAKYSNEMQRVTRLLDLYVELESNKPAIYEVSSSREGRIQPGFAKSKLLGELPGPGDGAAVYKREDIVISTRSLLEVMFYLSQGVKVPLDHQEKGQVTLTVDYDGAPFNWSGMLGDLFQIHP